MAGPVHCGRSVRQHTRAPGDFSVTQHAHRHRVVGRQAHRNPVGASHPHVAQIDLSNGRASDFARGLQTPIDVIVTKQGTLLLSDFRARFGK